MKALPEYKVSRARVFIPEEKKVNAETEEATPNVRASSSSIQTRVESNSLKFYWSSAPVSQCEHFNAQLDGFYYILKGIQS